MMNDGLDFNEKALEPAKIHTISKDPNVVTSQQEEDDIAKGE